MAGKRPGSVTAIIVIQLFRIVTAVGFIVVFAFVMNEESGGDNLASGIKDGMIASLHETETEPSFLLGLLMGKMFFKILFASLMLFFVKKRKYGVIVGLAITDLVVGFSQSVPYLNIVVLILVLVDSSRSYFLDKRSKVSYGDDQALDNPDDMP